MHFTIPIIVIAFASVSAITVLPSAKIPLERHSSSPNTNGSVDFDVLSAHAEYVMAKFARGIKNNIGGMHAVVNDNMARKRGFGIPLSHNKMMWYGSITIGTPAVSFSVNFDTGSADLVLPAAACDASCDDHKRWDPAKSANMHPVGEECGIKYSGGSIVTGDQYVDNVTIAGFTVDAQAFCAATSYSPHMNAEHHPPDGIMGMAFPSISAYKAKPVFENLVGEKRVDNKVFSFNLSSTGGELYIGGANRDLYKDDFVYTPVIEERFWKVTVENIQGKGKTILRNVDAIIDTGTAFMFGDPDRIEKIHDALGGEYYNRGYYTYPCDSVPDVKLSFNGKSFLISASAHNVGPTYTGSPDCWSGIASKEAATLEFWIIGGVFLQNVYTLFDYGNKRVGFAEHA